MSIPNSELYRELRALAKRLMSRERRDHTLSPTDLFHEAYTRLTPLLRDSTDQVESLPGLFAITMRRILIDHARKRARRKKRLTRVSNAGARVEQICEEWDDADNAEKLLELDEALTRLAAQYPLHAKVVELKYFGGLSVAACAQELGFCVAKTQRYWNFSRAWIAREIDRISLG